MRKALTLLFLLTVSLSAMSQNLSNDVMILERYHGNLRYLGTDDKLDKVALEQILNEEQLAIYEKAKKQHVASIPLWAVTGVTATVSTFCLYTGIRGHIYYNHHPEEYGQNGSPVIKTNLYPIFYMFSAIGYGITLISGIPAAILTIQSHRNLDNIVESYNANANDVSLNFGTTSNGVGLVLKF